MKLLTIKNFYSYHLLRFIDSDWNIKKSKNEWEDIIKNTYNMYISTQLQKLNHKDIKFKISVNINSRYPYMTFEDMYSHIIMKVMIYSSTISEYEEIMNILNKSNKNIHLNLDFNTIS